MRGALIALLPDAQAIEAMKDNAAVQRIPLRIRVDLTDTSRGGHGKPITGKRTAVVVLDQRVIRERSIPRSVERPFEQVFSFSQSIALADLRRRLRTRPNTSRTLLAGSASQGGCGG